MKLDKAIEIAQLITHQGEGCFDDDDLAALKLLIEAGKRVRASQEQGRNLDYQLLPGETTD